MGLLNFCERSGREKYGMPSPATVKEDRAEKAEKKHIDGLNLPGAEKGQY